MVSRGIVEKFSISDKLIKKFKSNHLKIDWEIYKEVRNDVQRMIKYKEKIFCRTTEGKYSKT